MAFVGIGAHPPPFDTALPGYPKARYKWVAWLLWLAVWSGPPEPE
jgi:hypothetical protein